MIHRINEIGLSTQSACGDVVRNVTCCPAPVQGDKVRREMRMLAQELAILFSPMAPTYARLWVDAKTLPSEFSNTDAQGMGEPIYGEQYLPRKFKIGLACSDDNCIDVYDQDIGLMAVRDGSGLLGYNVLVGGGLGTSPSDPKSFPALAVPLTFIQAAYVKVVCTAIVLTQRDFGDRSNRRQARLKYLIDRWGRDRFFQAVESRLDEAASILGAKPSEIPSTLPSPIELKPEGYDDHLGWYPQNDSCGYLGILVPNGRVRDSEEGAFKTGLRSVLERFDFPCAITAQQNLLLTRIPIEARQEVEGILCEHKIPLVERVSRLERHSMACPALPTCGLALAESERVIKHLVADFEQLLQQLKLSELRMELRMTGCPNGCSRPYNAEVALVGRSRHVASSQGVYDVFLGGSPSGHRLNRLFREKVRFGEVISALRPVMTRFSRERGNGESFGDYCDRVGLEALSDDSSTGQTTE